MTDLLPVLNQIVCGDSQTVLSKMPTGSIDLIVTDPPYGLGYMGKAWDTFTPSYLLTTQHRESRRRPRTAGRTVNRFQDASYTGVYDYSKPGRLAFQKFMYEVAFECLRVLKPGAFIFMSMTPRQDCLSRVCLAFEEAGFATGFTSLYWAFASGFPKALNIGKQLGPTFLGAYGGFQPKPAVEAIVVAMKPLATKTYVEQARRNGKGVTWLDDARIPIYDRLGVWGSSNAHCVPTSNASVGQHEYRNNQHPNGRFPANLLVQDNVLGDFSRFFNLDAAPDPIPFLLVPKASRAEKDAGLEHIEPRYVDESRKPGSPGGTNPRNTGAKTKRHNYHPTVKPLKLMSYLITLGSRVGDVVLDPFAGSGTTCIAAKAIERHYIGIEREREFVQIARARLVALTNHQLTLKGATA